MNVCLQPCSMSLLYSKLQINLRTRGKNKSDVEKLDSQNIQQESLLFARVWRRLTVSSFHERCEIKVTGGITEVKFSRNISQTLWTADHRWNTNHNVPFIVNTFFPFSLLHYSWASRQQVFIISIWCMIIGRNVQILVMLVRVFILKIISWPLQRRDRISWDGNLLFKCNWP